MFSLFDWLQRQDAKKRMYPVLMQIKQGLREMDLPSGFKSMPRQGYAVAFTPVKNQPSIIVAEFFRNGPGDIVLIATPPPPPEMVEEFGYSPAGSMAVKYKSEAFKTFIQYGDLILGKPEPDPDMAKKVLEAVKQAYTLRAA